MATKGENNMAQIYKNPLDQANSIAPETTRSKWNRYFKHIGDGNPRTVDKYNALIGEIESELPFENEEQHQKWLDLGSNWNGEDEWPNLTEKLLTKLESQPTIETLEDGSKFYYDKDGKLTKAQLIWPNVIKTKE